MVRIAKRKIRPRQGVAKAERGLEPLAFSIAEFAELHGISIDHYFRLARLGLGPRPSPDARAAPAANWRGASNGSARKRSKPGPRPTRDGPIRLHA